jgi:3',5'-cyclic AMP phosphodiesterase CpdA
MLIAQITDIHLGFPYDDLGPVYAERLARTVKMLCEMRPRPDLVLCTGDLTEAGDLQSFKELREALAPLPMPWFLAVGNHDLRGPLLEAFPETKTASGFVQYVIDQGPLRILVLDTLEEGRHAGAFGPERQRWLKARLDEAPDKPTLLVLHHPPVVTGIDWMSLDKRESWAPQLTRIVESRPQVIGAIAGHMHRPIVCPWAGTILRVSSSVAPQVTLNLEPMTSAHADNRTLVHQEAPAYALHVWTPETGLITHFGTVEEPPATLRYQDWFQKILKHFEEEREQEPAYPGETSKAAMPKAVYGLVAGLSALGLGVAVYFLFEIVRSFLLISPFVASGATPGVSVSGLFALVGVLLGFALSGWASVWAFRRLLRR